MAWKGRRLDEADGERAGVVRPDPPGVPPDRDAGFMLIEHVVAITVVFGVLLGLLSTLGSAVAGITTGRQKTIATSLAKQVIETLQGSYYEDIGMNLASPGLTTDSLVSGTAPNLTFEGEPLVWVAEPVHPAYRWETVDLGTTYTVRSFVTAVTPSGSAPYRRLTVFVDWTPAQRRPTQRIRFASLASSLDYTSFPAGSGAADVAGATFTLTGTVRPGTVVDVDGRLVASRATTSSSTLRTADGAASGPRATAQLMAGPLATTGCTVSGTSSELAECGPALLQAVADNDVGSTAPTWLGRPTTASAAMALAGPGNVVSVAAPAGSLVSGATASACTSCSSPAVGDDDALGYSTASASTTGALTVNATNLGTSALGATVISTAAGWSSSTTVDHDATGGGQVSASASLTAPAVTLFDLPGAQAGFTGAARRVGTFSATATAQGGNATSAPATTGSTVSVQLWDSTAPGGYRTVNVTPGTAQDLTTTGTVVSGSTTVTLTTHLLAAAATTSSTGSAPRTAAKAQHPSLLTVTVEAVVGTPEAGHLTLTFAYGPVTATAGWVVG